MIEVVKIPKHEFSFGTRKDIYILKLDGKQLFIPNLYLKSLAESVSANTLANRASHLKSFFERILLDNNSWTELSNSSKDVTQHRLAVANTVFQLVTDSYMNAYLFGLSNGQLSPSGKPISPKSLGIYITSFKGFYDFCYSKGFLSEKKEFTYRLPNLEPIKTATVGLNEAIHDLYYSKEDFKKVIGCIRTKNPFLKARDLLALKLTYFMGLRPHEIYKADNFNISRLKKIIDRNAPFNKSAAIKISGKGTGAGKNRNVVFTPEVYHDLKNFIYKEIPKFEHQSGIKVRDSIFIKLNGENYYGKKILSDTVWRGAVNAYIAANDLSLHEIETWQKRDLYSARHCFATNLILDRMKEGKRIDHIVVKELMGHTSITTTLAAYIYIGAVLALDHELKSKAIELYDQARRTNYYG